MESQLRFLKVSFNVNYLDQLMSRLYDGVMQVLTTTESIIHTFSSLSLSSQCARGDKMKERDKYAHMASDVSENASKVDLTVMFHLVGKISSS